MSNSTQNAQAFAEARRLHAAGRVAEAEQAYQQLVTLAEHREPVLLALAELYLQTGRVAQAIESLTALTQEVPDSLDYCTNLAVILEKGGQAEAAAAEYQRFLMRQPASANAHFNLALVFRNARNNAEAVAEYEAALQHGIDSPEEVYANLGVLYADMQQVDNARQAYAQALAIRPHYIPALFNLAGLLEEQGEREKACATYEQILEIDPGHADALSRVAHARRAESASDAMIGRLQNAITAARDEPAGRESLYFALGKTLDDIGDYEQAFDAYRSANLLGKRRTAAYRRDLTEQAVTGLIELFDADWLQRAAASGSASPIFVCGMFRSGSSLIEQILAAHPKIQTGGELDYLPWLLARRFAPYPESLRSISAEQIDSVASEYLEKVAALFPDAQHVTDKRPDNFLHLGLIRAMFPAARIVYTRRDRRDNSLSIYFQQLADDLAYATELANTLHYYDLHERLMTHWQKLLGESIFTVDYENLVRDPEPVLRALLDFLGLPWDKRCLEFHAAGTLAKTASLWQVRDPLHEDSVDRWKNYEPFIDGP